MISPRVPAGVLDLLPAEQIAFSAMLDTIRAAYERHGFVPLDTPVFELTEVLLGKSGGDTEKQIYFVQSTGALEKGLAPGQLPELALRFDCTVGMARYVAAHERALVFPYRRYAIQKVYRGERPQRGRGREFYQCDIDIIGRDDLAVTHDAEPLAAAYDAYLALGIDDVRFRINNRHLLRGLLASLGLADDAAQADVVRELDKLDKRGPEAVRDTLMARGDVAQAGIDELMALVATRPATRADADAALDGLRGRNGELDQGIDELGTVLDTLAAFGLPDAAYGLDFSISRGLDYYTGTVYEAVIASDEALGSVGAGGRYDDLAGHYTKAHLPGVGFSIGLYRVFAYLKDRGLADAAPSTAQILVALPDADLLPVALGFAREARAAGIHTSSVLEPTKLAKQFRQADRSGIGHVAIIGAAEADAGTVTLKDLTSGEQVTLPRSEAIERLRRA